jgi:hypothetical protein
VTVIGLVVDRSNLKSAVGEVPGASPHMIDRPVGATSWIGIASGSEPGKETPLD